MTDINDDTNLSDVQNIGAPPNFTSQYCPAGQHYDFLQNRCVLDSGSPATTTDGITIPSLEHDSYTLDVIDYNEQSEHNANGSFREHFLRNGKDLNTVVIGGYVQCDGPDDEEIECKLTGGTQSPSNNGINGRCYNIGISLDGDTVRLRKESRHAEYHDTPVYNTLKFQPRQGHYTGVIFMKSNILWNGKDAVRIKAWVDVEGMNDAGTFTAAKQNWVPIMDAIDVGGWYGPPYLTVAVPGDSRATIRVDQQEEATYDYKFGFAARISGGPGTH